jgi:transcription termination/antitermination protein NusG
MSVSIYNSIWFALQVRMRTEHQVADALRSKGYEQFLPTFPRHMRSEKPAKPLFPGYVFCRMTSEVQGPIVTTPGVIRIVSFGGKPASIDAEELASIRVIVEARVPVSTGIGLQVGDQVRIEEGPLRGVVGVLQQVDKRTRLVVSINMMMRIVATEVKAEWLHWMSPVERECSSRIAA